MEYNGEERGRTHAQEQVNKPALQACTHPHRANLSAVSRSLPRFCRFCGAALIVAMAKFFPGGPYRACNERLQRRLGSEAQVTMPQDRSRAKT